MKMHKAYNQQKYEKLSLPSTYAIKIETVKANLGLKFDLLNTSRLERIDL